MENIIICYDHLSGCDLLAHLGALWISAGGCAGNGLWFSLRNHFRTLRNSVNALSFKGDRKLGRMVIERFCIYPSRDMRMIPQQWSLLQYDITSNKVQGLEESLAREPRGPRMRYARDDTLRSHPSDRIPSNSTSKIDIQATMQEIVSTNHFSPIHFEEIPLSSLFSLKKHCCFSLNVRTLTICPLHSL